MNLLESYHQTYTYDMGDNLIRLAHQAQSNTWQQTISPHPHSNRGTENNNPNNFDTNGNLLNLDNIGTLNWHYNNTLNKLTKQHQTNTTEYYVYDHQGNRVRTVIESNNQAQSQTTYLPSLDILTNINHPQTNTLHIGTHILSKHTKDSTQTHYQLSNHLKTNTLELNDQAQIISYEHYYPYGGTAIIAGKDKTQVQQKRYRYTDKERDDSSGLYYYGARYLAPWLARWISPDSAGSTDGLNLYVYAGNNPLKYIDPTGRVKVYPFDTQAKPYSVDVLSLVTNVEPRANLFFLPEAYQKMENIVRNLPADIYRELDATTTFHIKSEGGLYLGAKTKPGPSLYDNYIDFSEGGLIFGFNIKNEEFEKHFLSINATQITAYQYLGMSKIAKSSGYLPRTFLRKQVVNDAAEKILKTYELDKNYSQFRENFLLKSDNGRSSLRISDAFGLEITSVHMERTITKYYDVRLRLQPQNPLRSIENPLVLPPRIP